MISDSDTPAQEAPAVLVGAFIDSSMEAVEFLAGEPGFRSAVTVEEMSDDELVTVAPDAVTGFFFARRTFFTTRLAGEVTYDDRDRVINLIVGSSPQSFGVTRQFALWEWVDVLGDSGRLESAEPSPTTANRVKTEVKQLGDVFREYVDRIVAAGPTVIQQLEAARSRRQAEWRAEHAKWEHDSGAARAAEAFRAGDYRRVVCLLESLGDRLTPSEQKKLAIARKRSTSLRGSPKD